MAITIYAVIFLKNSAMAKLSTIYLSYSSFRDKHKISSYYRSHPKDGGRLYFQSVHTCRRGHSVPGLAGGGVPRPSLDGGGGGGVVPHLRSGVGYPRQVWMVEGYPIPGLGWGLPQPGLDGWYLGYPPPAGSGWWEGTQGMPPTRQSSIASTCYAAGGMPLAFRKEDFLVYTNANAA